MESLLTSVLSCVTFPNIAPIICIICVTRKGSMFSCTDMPQRITSHIQCETDCLPMVGIQKGNYGGLTPRLPPAATFAAN